MKRIVVLAMARSGGKWLGSSLAMHPSLCAPNSPHGGMYEINVQGLGSFFSDVRSHDQYIGMATLLAETDFCKELSATPDDILKIEPRPISYIQTICRLLDAFAEENGKAGWVMKVPPQYAEVVKQACSESIFIAIIRERIDRLASLKVFEKRAGAPVSLSRHLYHSEEGERIISRMRKRGELKAALKYKEFKDSQGDCLSTIFKELDLSVVKIVHPSKENSGHSSFRRQDERRRVFSVYEYVKIALYSLILKLVPTVGLQLIKRLWGAEKQILRGTFSQKVYALGWEYDQQEPFGS